MDTAQGPSAGTGLSLPPLTSLIDGRPCTASQHIPVLDKYRETEIAALGCASRADVQRAIAVLSRGYARGAPPPLSRARILSRAADILEADEARIVAIMVAETGFTPPDAVSEVIRTAAVLRLCAEEATRIVGEAVSFAEMPGQEDRMGMTLRSPLGIVCAVTPFNSPLYTVAQKIGPALAAGNAVALKPSELTPLSAAILCEALLTAGLPTDLLALLHGHGEDVGAWLLDEPDIAFYSFTGSTRVGRVIQQGAGIRRTQMELGSISSTLVCRDASLAPALDKIVLAAFRKAGQVCMSVQRLYVERDIYPAVLDQLVALTRDLPVGDPRAPNTRVGPMISRAAAERVEAWVTEACADGADLLAGGTRQGTVMAPTLLAGAHDGMKVVDCEVFGPTLSIMPFDDYDTALAQANNSRFGLSAGVFTNDMARAMQAMKTLRFGCVHINETSSARADAMPFAGVKDSGFGPEGPRYAIRQMTEERLVTLNRI